jgi:hypothetical protein
MNNNFGPILTNYKITHELPNTLKLSTTVITYFNGNEWRCISLKKFLNFCVLHDVYYKENGESHKITLIVCPISLLTCIVDGTFYPKEFRNNILICENNNKEEFDFFTDKFKKREVEIKKLRNSFTDHPDLKYIIPTIKGKKYVPINYYTNKINIYSKPIEKTKIHPKSLVYIIEYKSSTSDKLNYTIIVGKNNSRDKPYGFNNDTTGIIEYMKIHSSELSYKSGFMFQILYYIAIDKFPNKKVIYL